MTDSELAERLLQASEQWREKPSLETLTGGDRSRWLAVAKRARELIGASGDLRDANEIIRQLREHTLPELDKQIQRLREELAAAKRDHAFAASECARLNAALAVERARAMSPDLREALEEIHNTVANNRSIYMTAIVTGDAGAPDLLRSDLRTKAARLHAAFEAARAGGAPKEPETAPPRPQKSWVKVPARAGHDDLLDAHFFLSPEDERNCRGGATVAGLPFDECVRIRAGELYREGERVVWGVDMAALERLGGARDDRDAPPKDCVLYCEDCQRPIAQCDVGGAKDCHRNPDGQKSHAGECRIVTEERLKGTKDAKPIAPGDVVQLRSGGPKMTVQSVVERTTIMQSSINGIPGSATTRVSEPTALIECAWYDETDGYLAKTLPAVALTEAK